MLSVLALYLQCAFLLGGVLAVQYGNSSGGGTSTVSDSLQSSAAITTAPSSSSSDCPPCFVFASEGGANILSKVVWYQTPVPITLDTVSVVVSKFANASNATITSATTIYGDVQKLNSRQVSVEASLQRKFSQLVMSNPAMQLNNYYNSMGQFVLANGTDGAVQDGVTSYAYPTPYLGINGFILYTSLPNDGQSGECQVSSAIEEAVNEGAGMELEGLGATTIFLSSTCYSPIPSFVPTATDIDTILVSFFENVGIETSSFSAFLQSDKALMSSFPELASCYYKGYGFGPPAVKIPVSALTATVSTTAIVAGPPVGFPRPVSTPKPAVVPSTTPLVMPAAQTTPDRIEQLASSLSSQPPPSSSRSQPEGSPHGIPDLHPCQNGIPPVHVPNASPVQNQASPTQSLPDVASPNPASPTQPSPGLPAQNPEPQILPASQDENGPNQVASSVTSQNTSPSGDEAAPIISYAGVKIQPDASTRYDVPEVGVIQPGGVPVTTNGIVYSLGPSATALYSGGSAIPITPANDQLSASPQPPVLSLGSSVYTADSELNFIIGTQTLASGSTKITVSATPISLAPGGSIAIIGSSTTILGNPDLVVPTMAPILTLGNTTYTASTSSAFLIVGQTVSPGGSVTISGTPIVYPSTGNAVVIRGTSTQTLATAAVSEQSSTALVMTLARSTYIADSASAFDIGGQKLTKGGALTVSGTPISYPNGNEGDVVIGTSTEGLGNIIMNGFGNGGSGSNASSSAVVFNSSGAVYWQRISGWTALFGASIAVIISWVLL